MGLAAKALENRCSLARNAISERLRSVISCTVPVIRVGEITVCSQTKRS